MSRKASWTSVEFIVIQQLKNSGKSFQEKQIAHSIRMFRTLLNHII